MRRWNDTPEPRCGATRRQREGAVRFDDGAVDGDVGVAGHLGRQAPIADAVPIGPAGRRTSAKFLYRRINFISALRVVSQ